MASIYVGRSIWCGLAGDPKTKESKAPVPIIKPLADRLKRDLEAKGRLAWHQESCGRLIADCAQGRRLDLDSIWRIKGSHHLDRPALAVLREVWQWREREAVAANKRTPPQ